MDRAASEQLFLSLGRRLKENVRAGHPDQADGVLELPAGIYRDPARFDREVERIFKRAPLLVTLSCDVPVPGDYVTLTIVGHPLLVVRGDDGVARVFLNICRHRGAALTRAACGHSQTFVCPYHAWSYDLRGRLKGISDRRAFGEFQADGLVELPADEAVGAIFASLDVNNRFSAEAWLGDMAEPLAALDLAGMHPYRKTSTLKSPNWKLTADGYLDGYHLGYLHRNSIGAKSITNRNTYDFFGPHVRIGFANRDINHIDSEPLSALDLHQCMSLVHYIFPNVSISGGHTDTIQLSRLFPGPTVDASTTVQHQYFREPVTGEREDAAEAKRRLYEQVVREEDYETVFSIDRALPAMEGMNVVFGRNEPANQHLHRTIESWIT